eukprot:gnl/Ergobibamus_cyprinoides/440.p2 GENE.gnl/Ergobibamus_cyprinoides/440~~gnl/Ergobibamus_cyprinoides/440.p2  ORF type:complete len:143 (+),score=61.12 gnl/Ergobibamus_cyprinoides/440:635-1063(+)
MMMTYGNVYVATVSMGADPAQCIAAMKEAEDYDGPAIIIAYSPCIAHGIVTGMGDAMKHEEMAVSSGYWPLYRFDPRRKAQGLNPFQMDSGEPTIPLEEFLNSENRFVALQRQDPEAAVHQRELLKASLEAKRAALRLLEQA